MLKTVPETLPISFPERENRPYMTILHTAGK